MHSKVCPEEWKDCTTLPFYKRNYDPLQCGKYRGLRLLKHGMKLWRKILEGRMKAIIKISDNQFGFSAGKSTTDAIFIFRHIQQKYTEKKKKLYHMSIVLEKLFEEAARAGEADETCDGSV